MSEDIDPENLDSFSIPESLLEQLFEFSGSGDHSKGFILAFVTQQGKPLVYTKAQNQIVEMGLRKSLEKYLILTDLFMLFFFHGIFLRSRTASSCRSFK